MSAPDLHTQELVRGLHHYMLVAAPGLEIAEKLTRARAQCFDEVETEGSGKLPFVTITEFLAKQEMEETIIRLMQRIASGQHAFRVTFNNYSGFPGRSVFVRIQDHQPFRQLAAQLQPIDDYLQRNDCPPVNFISQPHLPLMEHLGNTLYEQVIGNYSRQDFHETFEVTELMLVCTEHRGDTPVKRAVLKLQPALHEQN